MGDMTILSHDKLEKTKSFFTKIHNIQMDYASYWFHHTLWEWEFWLSCGLSILPWFIWFLFRRRGSEARLLLVGSFSIIIASWLDFIGVITGVWSYSGKFLPTIPTFLPWDFSILPVFTMLWLQFRPSWHPLIKASIFAIIPAFIGEPISNWIGIYSTHGWYSYYSFPIYFVIFLVAYRISRAKSFGPI